MLSKVYHISAIGSIAVTIGVLGFAGYLFGVGRLNGERIEQIAAVLRGEGGGSATSQPASQPVLTVEQVDEQRAQAVDELRKARRDEQIRRAVLERAAQEVNARQALLDRSLHQLVTLGEQFERDRASWREQQSKLAAKSQEGGFVKELEYVNALDPKQAKEHIVRAWRKSKADVVRLFMALETDKGTSILRQLKDGPELEILHELLEQLRIQDVDKFAAQTRTETGG
ncbi:MAG: hypothetical protein CHACPFDD_00990 [Phycisphaerae bacterium]|nr:hypothetical protein [Phycisphaerae bacterium]